MRRSKPSPDNSNSAPSPAPAAAMPAVLSADQVQAVLPLLPALAALVQILLGGAAPGGTPAMLSAEEFAQRHPNKPKAETVERWCREGILEYAISYGKGGWLIPEFQLSSTQPPDALRHWFPARSGDSENRDSTAQSAPAAPEASPALEATDANVPADDTRRRTSDGFDVERVFDFKQNGLDEAMGRAEGKRQKAEQSPDAVPKGNAASTAPPVRRAKAA